MCLQKALTELSNFIDRERWKYPHNGNNSFNVSLRQPKRYLEFLSIVRSRHKDAVTDFNTYSARIYGTGREQSTIPGKVLDALDQKARLVQLETETFFIFSNIYLDKIGHFIENYFGNARGLSLQSHSKLQTNFENYIAQKSLVVPKVFLKDIAWLRDNVGITRDKQITHQKNPRTLHGITGRGDLLIHYYMPTEKDQYSESPGIKAVSERLSIYTNRLTRLVQRNRSLSRFSAKET
jgi:hypothetical protein